MRKMGRKLSRQKPNGEARRYLSSTVPSILRFHLDRREPGMGLRDLRRPACFSYMRRTLSISLRRAFVVTLWQGRQSTRQFPSVDSPPRYASMMW